MADIEQEEMNMSEERKEMELIEAIDRLSIVENIRKTNSDKIGSRTARSEYPSWESLPWPALTRIYYYLRTHEYCADLANLAQVSTRFHSGVNEFMTRAENRPGIEHVNLANTVYGFLAVKISLFPSNLPFYGLSSLDSDRFNRLVGYNNPMLHVTLNGLEDPIVEQAADLLSSTIERVSMFGWAFTPSNLSLFEHLLRNSTIKRLIIRETSLDDTIARHIISLASHSELIALFCSDTQLSNSASFITQLYSHVSTSFLIDNWSSTTSFFGLPHSFWKKFLNEKLANGSCKSVKTGNSSEIITKAPFILPDSPIRYLEWRKMV